MTNEVAWQVCRGTMKESLPKVTTKIRICCDKTEKMLRHFSRYRFFPNLLSIVTIAIFIRCPHLAARGSAVGFQGRWDRRGPDDPVPAVIDGDDYSKEMRAVSTKAAPSTTARTVAKPTSVELMRPRVVPAAPVGPGWVITSFCRLDTRVTVTPGTGL